RSHRFGVGACPGSIRSPWPSRASAKVRSASCAGCVYLCTALRVLLAHAPQGFPALGGRLSDLPALAVARFVRTALRSTSATLAQPRAPKPRSDSGGSRFAVRQDISPRRNEGL